jgi:hypothetical protein
MSAFHEEIRREDQLARRRRQDRAVIADADLAFPDRAAEFSFDQIDEPELAEVP